MFPKQIFVILIALFTLLGCQSEQVDDNPTKVEASNDVEGNFVFPKLPEKVNFAGVTIPIDNFDLRERLDKELIVNTFYHSSTIQSFKRANRYFKQISEILKTEGVPDDFKYLCLIESGLTQATSPSGAKGFWQFMPATAKDYDLVVNNEIDERLHIEKSTRAACSYLKDANSTFNDWVLTAASYNRGVNGTKNDLLSQHVNDYFDLNLNNETSRYVFRIIALKIIFETPEAYGFNPDAMELYEPIETQTKVVDESIKDLALWSVKNGTTLRMVKLLNPWIRLNKLTVKNNELEIAIPKF